MSEVARDLQCCALWVRGSRRLGLDFGWQLLQFAMRLNAVALVIGTSFASAGDERISLIGVHDAKYGRWYHRTRGSGDLDAPWNRAKAQYGIAALDIQSKASDFSILHDNSTMLL